MNNNKFYSAKKGLIPFFLLLITTLFITSCVYFNTFYNARKYFESAQGYQIPEGGRPPARAIQDYQKVIEKCTYILNEHPDSKWADNALFLLARSVYYQRRNILQARERFNDMLRVFPDSEFIPESKIYLARVERQLNNPSEAYSILNDLVGNQSYASYHPRTLLLRSKWYIDDNDIPSSQSDLNRIINEFPRSDEFQEAFLKLGSSYLDQGNYTRSKELFESLVTSRASRRIRFDARYYMALSNFYLRNYEAALEQVNSLANDEYEASLFPRLYLLRSRIFSGQSMYLEAQELFKRVIEENRRTLISAEANYYLAEMYFIDLADYEKALEHYSNVSTESRTSPLVSKAMGRSSVVSQLIQLSSDGQSLSTQQLVQEQFKLAEYYLYEMNIPDSSLSVYNNIERQKEKLVQRYESLQSQLEEIDSDTTEVVIEYIEEQEPIEPVEEQELIEPVEEQEPIEPAFHNEELFSGYEAYEDSLWDEQGEPLLDEVELAADPEEEAKPSLTKQEQLQQELQSTKEAIALYETEFVPYANFLSMWIWLNELDNPEKAASILAQMEERFPDNRYLYATRQLMNKETITLLHPVEIEIEQAYEQALNLLAEDSYAGLSRLKELQAEIDSELQQRPSFAFERLREIQHQILYTIGFSYYFDMKDSTSARNYFEELLTEAPESKYSETVLTFYKNNRFVVIDSLTIPKRPEQPQQDSPIFDDPTGTRPPDSYESSVIPPVDYPDHIVPEDDPYLEHTPSE